MRPTSTSTSSGDLLSSPSLAGRGRRGGRVPESWPTTESEPADASARPGLRPTAPRSMRPGGAGRRTSAGAPQAPVTQGSRGARAAAGDDAGRAGSAAQAYAGIRGACSAAGGAPGAGRAERAGRQRRSRLPGRGGGRRGDGLLRQLRCGDRAPTRRSARAAEAGEPAADARSRTDGGGYFARAAQSSRTSWMCCSASSGSGAGSCVSMSCSARSRRRRRRAVGRRTPRTCRGGSTCRPPHLGACERARALAVEEVAADPDRLDVVDHARAPRRSASSRM